MDVSSSPPIERLRPDFMHRPFELFARLRAEGPAREVVMPHGAKVWMVTRYEDVRALLTDPRVSKEGTRMNEMFARHSGVPLEEDSTGVGFDDDLSAHMMNSDPPRHTRLRKLVTKAFTARRMEALRPRVGEVAEELLAALDPAGEVDLIRQFAMPLPITIVFDLLGVPLEDRDAFRGWAEKLVGAGHDPDEVAEASRRVTEYSHQLIDAKLAHPDDALVSALAEVTEDGDRLTRSELVAMIFLLLAAGSETPANQIGLAVHALLNFPEELAKLRVHPELMPAAVEELLRYDSGVGTASFRFTTAEIDVDGVTIPAEEMLVLSFGSANRDPDHFPEPDRLDLDRHPAGALAFGFGIHYCVGAPLARIIMEESLGRLITRFPELRLAVPEHELTFIDSTLVHGLAELPVLLGPADGS